jgi:hypothetical protein
MNAGAGPTNKKVEMALGRGRFGCVFRASLDPDTVIALKVIAAEAGNPSTMAEYHRLLRAADDHPNLVAKVMRDSLVECVDFAYYSLTDVGRNDRDLELSARAIFMKLCDLHLTGTVHGDPRTANIILLRDDSLRWIDLRVPYINTIAADVAILAKDFRWRAADDPDVQECILNYSDDVSIANMTALYEVCRNITE